MPNEIGEVRNARCKCAGNAIHYDGAADRCRDAILESSSCARSGATAG